MILKIMQMNTFGHRGRLSFNTVELFFIVVSFYHVNWSIFRLNNTSANKTNENTVPLLNLCEDFILNIDIVV